MCSMGATSDACCILMDPHRLALRTGLGPESAPSPHSAVSTPTSPAAILLVPTPAPSTVLTPAPSTVLAPAPAPAAVTPAVSSVSAPHAAPIAPAHSFLMDTGTLGARLGQSLEPERDAIRELGGWSFDKVHTSGAPQLTSQRERPAPPAAPPVLLPGFSLEPTPMSAPPLVRRSSAITDQ